MALDAFSAGLPLRISAFVHYHGGKREEMETEGEGREEGRGDTRKGTEGRDPQKPGLGSDAVGPPHCLFLSKPPCPPKIRGLHKQVCTNPSCPMLSPGEPQGDLAPGLRQPLPHSPAEGWHPVSQLKLITPRGGGGGCTGLVSRPAPG